MANDVEIRVTGDDDSGRAFTSATANAKKFKTEAKDAGSATKLLGSDLSAAAREADKTAGSTLRVAMAARQLDREIEDAGKSLRTLRAEQALTDKGSGDFTQRIRDQERALADLKRARSQLGTVDFSKLISLDDAREHGGKAGGVMASATLTGFGSTARSLGPVAGSFGIAIAMQVVATAGPLVTAGIGAAITAGAGLGIAGLGIALIKEDARIRAAGGRLVQGLKEGMASQAGVLIDPVLDSLEQLRAQGNRIMPAFGRMFANVAPSVSSLTRGITGLINQAMPGLEALSKAAGPVIDRIASELPGLGSSIGRMFGSIADVAPQAAEGIGDLIDMMGAFIRFAGWAIESGTRMWGIFKGLITLDFGKIKDAMTSSNEDLKGSQAAQESWLTTVRQSTAAAVDYAAGIREMASAQLAAENTAIGFEEALDETATAARRAKGGIDANTEAGRTNRTQLLRLASATMAHVESLRRTNAPANAVTGAMNRGRTAFIAAATAMGASKKEAERLATALFRLDGINVSPTVNVRVLGASRIAKVENQLARLGAFDHGGIVGAADSGGIRNGLTLVGERGPELVDLPAGSRVTPHAQTRDVMAGGGQSSSPAPIILEVHGGMGDLERAVVKFIVDRVRRRGGGSVQLAFGTAT